MTRSTGQRAFHFKNVQPADPTLTPFAAWPPANQKFLPNSGPGSKPAGTAAVVWPNTALASGWR